MKLELSGNKPENLKDPTFWSQRAIALVFLKAGPGRAARLVW